ncbi:MAG: hypothetical protein C5B53_01240 [Candidatus Melainabacteria bacterium]|nr:MAG: hypothetical protein C5B53_01240 [Candidatus Melainabacteria bacterium]
MLVFEKRMRFFLILSVFSLAPIADEANAAVPTTYTCLRNFYVSDLNGNDNNDGHTPRTAWKTLQRPDRDVRAGDCVIVADGTYAQSWEWRSSYGGNTNRPDGYVVYRAAHKWGAKITGTSKGYNLVRPLGSFLIFDGFELDGSGGVQGAAFASDPSTDPHSQGHTEGTPGTVGGSQGHHIGVFNMNIHDFAGAGISLTNNDYFTIWKNVVHDTSKRSPYQESGISVWQPHAIYNFKPTGSYDVEKFHIKILNNISYNNYTSDAVKEDHSDGNGIIIDAWKHDQTPPYDTYPYEGLVQGNLVYANGGKGIQVAFSANVTVANNTAIGNNRDPLSSATWRGEINVALSDNVTVINNVMLATPDPSEPRQQHNTAAFEGATGRDNSSVLWTNNLTFNTANNDACFNASAPTLRARIIADFQAANPLMGVDPKVFASNVNVFKIGLPAPGSPVLFAGTPTPEYPPVSLSGAAQSDRPNIGAW